MYYLFRSEIAFGLFNIKSDGKNIRKNKNNCILRENICFIDQNIAVLIYFLGYTFFFLLFSTPWSRIWFIEIGIFLCVQVYQFLLRLNIVSISAVEINTKLGNTLQ